LSVLLVVDGNLKFDDVAAEFQEDPLNTSFTSPNIDEQHFADSLHSKESELNNSRSFQDDLRQVRGCSREFVRDPAGHASEKGGESFLIKQIDGRRIEELRTWTADGLSCIRDE
jgi:hypothetical protein